jgi:hypothetical protein
MIRTLTTTIAAAVILSAFGVGKAKAQGLSGADRALLYYYSFYTNQQNSKMLRSQQQVIKDLQRVERAENRILTRPDPIEQYIRQGRAAAPGQIPLPPIYSGRRQYFQRFDSFNPPQGRQ